MNENPFGGDNAANINEPAEATVLKVPPRPVLEEYPYQSRYYRRPDGLALHYLDEGRGRPVIMVHGNPSWSFMWRHLVDELSADYRCLVPDHMGMGLSSRPETNQYGFHLADRVADLNSLVRHWRLDQPAHLVVHDWGGPIGLAWAAANPDKVASVTVMNSGTRIPPQYRLPFKLAIFKYFKPLGEFLAWDFNLFAWGTAVFGVKNKLSPATRQGFLAPYQKAADRLAVAKFVEDIPLDSRHPSFAFLNQADQNLPELLDQKPLSLVWGLADFVFNRSVCLDWRERFPQAPFLALPEAGHYLMEDEPEPVRAFVRKFISNI